MAVSSKTTTKEPEQQEKKVSVEFFHIDMIPDAMRNMGWEMAPKLMEHWFSISPAYSFDKSSKNEFLDSDARILSSSIVNDKVITMAWAIQFEQVAAGIQLLKKNWNTIKSRNVLRKRLVELGCDTKSFSTIGMTNDVKILDSTAQVNFQRIGNKTDTINDWYGAVGNANLKVCIRGSVISANEKLSVHVDALGFYLKDTYDFLDDDKFGIDIPECLGVWGKSRVLNKTETASYMTSYTSGGFGILVRQYSGFVPVFNSDFRKWQEKHGKGGDYIVFSDVLWVYPLDKDKVIDL
ncbi:DUF6402 family protein [Enterobacter bugandensis]|uniref:DUF6402 family protein n=1 Tax=Enterobacter bugandensis TaxID=881260 RepID=UPI000B497A39|nr:DUF6402 family protein [Enterobacter bugandensis]QWZ47941.1 hypothetical protein I6L57_12070 [Enterobacter bugandensis]UBH41990.1 DUF6402 family protein [Enterobacter bugandensis]UBH91907.1 DUF6402 family protein [Enterobacter bugandensis]UBI00306.1 DUF6402 family protein [Enterobacter bugandensis]